MRAAGGLIEGGQHLAFLQDRNAGRAVADIDDGTVGDAEEAGSGGGLVDDFGQLEIGGLHHVADGLCAAGVDARRNGGSSALELEAEALL